jgi:hypothetical protein
MGILKKAKFLNTLKRIGLGITDAIGVTSVLKANKDYNHNVDQNGSPVGSGKVDYIRLVVAICTILGFIGVMKGWIDKDTFKDLIKILN